MLTWFLFQLGYIVKTQFRLGYGYLKLEPPWGNQLTWVPTQH